MTEKDVGGVSGARLKSFVERIERLAEEKQAIADDIKDVFAESKGVGFDVPTLRRVIAKRKIDREKRQEMESLEDTYMSALGEK